MIARPITKENVSQMRRNALAMIAKSNYLDYRSKQMELINNIASLVHVFGIDTSCATPSLPRICNSSLMPARSMCSSPATAPTSTRLASPRGSTSSSTSWNELLIIHHLKSKHRNYEYKHHH